MADLEVRILRMLVTLADVGAMSRAAHLLHISQPALSKQLAHAEQTTGLRLFERHPKGVTPTVAGRMLLDRARAVIREVDALSAAAVRARRDLSGQVRLGFVAQTVNEDTRVLLRTYVERNPGVTLDKRQYDLRDLTAGLAAGDTDVAFLRQPLSAPGLTHEPMFVEPRVAVLCVSHPLAGRVSVAVAELFDTPWVVNATPDPAYRDFALATRQREGRPALLGPTVHTIDEFLEAVLSDQAIGLAPASAARYYPRPGVSYVPVPDADPSVCTLSWRADRDPTPAAQALVDLVRSTLPWPRGQVTRSPRGVPG
jgi:DNA-binding transcriptional LysR family regulator